MNLPWEQFIEYVQMYKTGNTNTEQNTYFRLLLETRYALHFNTVLMNKSKIKCA